MNRKVLIAIVAVVVLLLCCGAVACTPIGNTVGVHAPGYDGDHRKSKKTKKCVKYQRGKCKKYKYV